MITLNDISMQQGRQILFLEASMQLNPGEKVGLVGPNGAGKTTLFRVIAGEEEPDEGEVTIPRRTTIGYFRQDTAEMKGRSVLDEAIAGSGRLGDLHHELKEVEAALADPARADELEALLARYGEVQGEYHHRGGYDLEARAQEVLHGLGFEQDQIAGDVGELSGGWKTRVAMAKVLLAKPDVLLLDEPTNHLDIESILWLEQFLKGSPAAVLMTCHDRDFMNRIVTTIIEVANGGVTTYNGNYDFYLREREIRREQLQASHRRQQDMLAKEEEFIARFAARASHAAQVQSRVKKLEKIERIELPPEQRAMRFEFAEPPRSGDDVVRLTNLGKAWPLDNGADKSVFGGISGVIRRQEKIAVVGVNGAGKSTFLKVLTGQTKPTTGHVTLGANVFPGYFSQHSMEVLDPQKSVFESVQETMPLASIGAIRNLCAAFLFQGDTVEKKVEQLSGGEKSRVVLATILARPLNFLVLDEPTNHLDIQSREVLLTALQKFTGTVVLVSHDRHFLRSLVSRVFAIDHGEMRTYEGDYGYYLEKAKAERTAGACA